MPVEERYFVRNLSDEQLENFMVIYDALLTCESDLISLPHPMSDPEQETETQSYLLYYSCPELVQLSTNYMYRSWRNDGTAVQFTLIMTLSEYQEACIDLFNTLNELHRATRGMTDWEKSKYVYDYIIDRTAYDMAASDAVNPHEGSCLGPLSVGKARCQGYANAYQICMWAVGLECYAVTGIAQPGDVPHAWNVTNLDGDYYLSDVTWDDQADIPTVYQYFHVSTAEFPDHEVDGFWEDLGLPICDSMNMSLFAVQDSYIEADEDLKTELIRILDASYRKNTDLCLKVESPEDFVRLIQSDVLSRCISEWAWKHNLMVEYGCMTWSNTRVVYLQLAY
jgi:hypothetical protein